MSTGYWPIDALAIAGFLVVFGIPAAFGIWHLVDLWRGRERPQHRKKGKGKEIPAQ